ncbi:MAG: Lrp/AsnC family transcriptional regulator [Pseudomonadota bacterium]
MDALDKKLVKRLSEDGRAPIGTLAAQLEVTPPTVRNRIKSLTEAGDLKISGMIDPERRPELTTALVGLRIQSHGKLEQELEHLAELEGVQWAAVVTGQYDVIMEVVVSGGMSDLYQMMTQVVPKIGQVIQTETFVVMKSRRKWISPPREGEGW